MTHENAVQLINLRMKLLLFQKAYNELSEALEEYSAEDVVELDTLITDFYPFKESFPEMNIRKWTQNSILEINKYLKP